MSEWRSFSIVVTSDVKDSYPSRGAFSGREELDPWA